MARLNAEHPEEEKPDPEWHMYLPSHKPICLRHVKHDLIVTTPRGDTIYLFGYSEHMAEISCKLHGWKLLQPD